MSKKFPCVYYDNCKCQKFSDDNYTSWCDFEQCEFITPSNADRIRAMDDEELVELLLDDFLMICKKAAPEEADCYGACRDCVLIWLRKAYEEEEKR